MLSAVSRLPAAGALAAAWVACALALACSRSAEVSGSPSEGLVFVRKTAEGTDLFRARIADGAIERLTHTPDRNEDWPEWSDRIRRLAFLTAPFAGRRSWDLLVWSPERRSEASIYASGQTEYFLDWSPGSAHLAYSHQTAEGPFVVAQVDVEANVRQVLTSANGSLLVRPSFAFDGRRLLAQELRSDRTSRILLLEPGHPARNVTGAEPFYDDHPRFTRNDEWVTFDRRASPTAPGDVLLIRPDGSETRNLTDSPEHDDHSPRPSPVRDELVFVSDRDGTPDIHLVDYATGARRNLTATPDAGEWMPRFSPDGERIVFVILPPDFRPGRGPLDYGAARIAVIDREGRRLFETDGINPAWMPAWK
ncbi:MAG TPA: hypothetical protein VIN04_07830 [Myxococcota bacterium]